MLEICTRSSVRTFFVEESSVFSLEPPRLCNGSDGWQSHVHHKTDTKCRNLACLSISSKKTTHGVHFFACSKSFLILFSLSPQKKIRHLPYFYKTVHLTHQTIYSTNLSWLPKTMCKPLLCKLLELILFSLRNMHG